MDIEPAPAEEHHAMRRRTRLNMMSSRFYEPSALRMAPKICIKTSVYETILSQDVIEDACWISVGTGTEAG